MAVKNVKQIMVSKKKNILWITPFFRPNIGGVESHLNDLSEILIKKDYNVVVLTYKPLTNNVKGLSKEVINNFQIRRYRWFGNNLFHKLEKYPLLEFLYITPYLFLSSFLFTLLHHSRIDVIHAHGLNAAFIARIIAHFFKKRIVMSTYAVYNFNPDKLFSKIVAWVLRPFDKILSLGNQSRKELLKIGIPEEKIATYYLWIAQDLYKPLPKQISKESIGFSNKFLALFVGRYIAAKGVDIIIELSSQLEQIQFILIGDAGPLLGKIKNEAKKRNNITVVEGIMGLKLIPYYQAADILLVPSIYPEAFGKVVIEAFSCGTPVLASNAGALADIVTSPVGKTGPATVEFFKKELEYFYNHPDVLAEIAANCRSYAEEYFSHKNAATIENCYHS